MTGKMKIEIALAELEAGRFSFRMVDAVKEHVARLESELKVVSALHADALRDLRRQELANWRLEGELRKLNADIRTLIKANRLTEKAFREAKPFLLKMSEYFEAARKIAIAYLEKAAAYLSTLHRTAA